VLSSLEAASLSSSIALVFQLRAFATVRRLSNAHFHGGDAAAPTRAGVHTSPSNAASGHLVADRGGFKTKKLQKRRRRTTHQRRINNAERNRGTTVAQGSPAGSIRVSDPRQVMRDLEGWLNRNLSSHCFDTLSRDTLTPLINSDELVLRISKVEGPSTAEVSYRVAAAPPHPSRPRAMTTTSTTPPPHSAAVVEEDGCSFEGLLSADDLSTVAPPSVPRQTWRDGGPSSPSLQHRAPRTLQARGNTFVRNDAAQITGSDPKRAADELLEHVKKALLKDFFTHGIDSQDPYGDGAVKVTCDMSRSSDIVDDDDADVVGGGGSDSFLTKSVDVVVATVSITFPQPSSPATRRPSIFRNDDEASDDVVLRNRCGDRLNSFKTATVVGEGAGENELAAVIEALVDAFVEADMDLPECVASTKVKLIEQASISALTHPNGDLKPQGVRRGGPLSPLTRSVAGRLWKSIAESLAAAPWRFGTNSQPLAHAALVVRDEVPCPSSSLDATGNSARRQVIELLATNHEDPSLVSATEVLASVMLTYVADDHASGAAFFPVLPIEYLRCLDLAVEALNNDTSRTMCSSPSSVGAAPLIRLDELLSAMPCVIPMAARGSLHSIAKWSCGHYLGFRRSLSHRHEIGAMSMLHTTTSLWLPRNASSLSRRVVLDARDGGNQRKRAAAVAECLGYELRVARGAPAGSNDDARDAALRSFLCIGPASSAETAAANEKKVTEAPASETTPQPVFPFPTELHGQLSVPVFLDTLSSLKSFSQTLQHVGNPPPFERGIVSQLKWLADACGEEVKIESTKLCRAHVASAVCWQTSISVKKKKDATSGDWVIIAAVKDLKKSNSTLRAAMFVFDLPQYRPLMASALYTRFFDDAAPAIAAGQNPATKKYFEDSEWVPFDDQSGAGRGSIERGVASNGVATQISELESVSSITTPVADIRRGPSLHSIVQRSIHEVVTDDDFANFIRCALGEKSGQHSDAAGFRSLHVTSSSDVSPCGHIVTYRLNLAVETAAETNVDIVQLCAVDVDVAQALNSSSTDQFSMVTPSSWHVTVLCSLHALWSEVFCLDTDVAKATLFVSRHSFANSEDEDVHKDIRRRFWKTARESVNEAATFCSLPTPDHCVPSSDLALGSWLSGDVPLPRRVEDVLGVAGGKQSHPLDMVATFFSKIYGETIAVDVREVLDDKPIAESQDNTELEPMLPRSAQHMFCISVPAEMTAVTAPQSLLNSAKGSTKTSAGLAACESLLARYVCPLVSTCRQQQRSANRNKPAEAKADHVATPHTDASAAVPTALTDDDHMSLLLTFPPLEPNSVGGQLIAAIFQTIADNTSRSSTPSSSADIASIDGVRFGVVYQPSWHADGFHHSSATARRHRMFRPFVEIEYSISTVVSGGGQGKTMQITPSVALEGGEAGHESTDGASMFSALAQLWSLLITKPTPPTATWELLPWKSAATNKAQHEAELELLDRWNNADHLARLASLSEHVIASAFTPPRILQQTIPSQLIDIYSRRFFGVSMFTSAEMIPRTADWRTELTTEVMVRRPVRFLDLSDAHNSIINGPVAQNDDPPQRCQFVLGASLGQGKKLSYKMCAVPLLQREIIAAAHRLQSSSLGHNDCSSRGVSPTSPFWNSDHFSTPADGRNTTMELNVRIKPM
jgi:hypothetical protein